jgi:hypothetical protein
MASGDVSSKSPWWIDHLDELVAAFLAIGGFICLCLHIDTEVKSITALATGWLFKSGYENGRAYLNRRNNGG